MNKRTVGNRYEDIAVDWLLRNGFRIITRNFRTRDGEIDIICQQKDVETGQDILVFVEVKYRKNRRAGSPEEAITPAKMRKIMRVADYYRVRYQVSMEQPCRFDVIAIEGESLRHYENAFGA